MQPPPLRPSPVSVDTKQTRIEDLLRRSLLGDEIIDTQFHLFAARAKSCNRVTQPRALSVNNVLLTSSSSYFSALLDSTKHSDTSLIEITGNEDVPTMINIDDYGYGSDSDLDDDGPPRKGKRGASRLPRSPEFQLGWGVTDISSEEDVEPPSGVFIVDTDPNPRSDTGRPKGIEVDAVLPDQSAPFLSTLSCRRIFVKDTAFQTWYTLLYYLYTGEINFLPLKSARRWAKRSLTSSGSVPKCSAKSMYRLADKVGLEDLRDKALAFLRNNITEDNILEELASSLISRYPPLLEMTLDVLYSCIASGSVVIGFPALAKRIANKEFPHGADIVVGLHRRFLKEHHPMALENILLKKRSGSKNDYEEGARSGLSPAPSIGVVKKKRPQL